MLIAILLLIGRGKNFITVKRFAPIKVKISKILGNVTELDFNDTQLILINHKGS